MLTLKQSLDNWAGYMKLLTDSTYINPDETEQDRNTRKTRLEGDPEEWFKYYFPKYTFAEPAAFHTEATSRIVANPEWYEVRLWSRELAKSTRTMMEVLYLVLVGQQGTKTKNAERITKKYCLLISNSFDNATRLLTPYKLNFECNQRIIQDYGNQVNTGKWQASEFTTELGASFRALGAGQSPRGTRNEEVRPDILLFDDLDTDADCLNPDIIAKKWRWIEEAAIGTRSVSQSATIIFCGNLIATDCCIARAMPFADVVDRREIRDKDGKSTWPQKNTEEDIDRVLKQKSYSAAQKEYFNNPITEGTVFKEMAYKPALPLTEYEAVISYTDPSYTEKGDYKATVLIGKWKSEYHIIKAFVEQTTTANMLEWHKTIVELTRKLKHKCPFFMEHVFMQDVIINEINERARQQLVPVHLKSDRRNKPNKQMRIEALLEPLNRNGFLYLNEAEKYNPHMIRLEEQFKAFSFNSNAHDDAPDAVEGAIWLLTQHGKNDAKALQNCGVKRRTSKY